MTDDQADAVLLRMCEGKKKMGAKGARAAAASVSRTSGEDVHAYRCAVCRGWHIGHTPSMESVEAIAEAIRHRSYPTDAA